MDFRERLDAIVLDSGYSYNGLALEINRNRNYLNDLREKGKMNKKQAFSLRLLESELHYSIDWLWKEVGEMKIIPKGAPIEQSNLSANFILHVARNSEPAFYQPEFNQAYFDDLIEWTNPFMHKKNYSFEVPDDCMLPLIGMGDIIICSATEITDFEHIIQNYIYVVFTSERMHICRVSDNIDKNKLTLSSDHEGTKEVVINKSDIVNMYKGKAMMSSNLMRRSKNGGAKANPVSL